MEPNVIINLVDKKGKKRSMRGGAVKMKKRTLSSLMNIIKMGKFKRCTIEVIYDKKKEFTNSMDITNFSDLKWAFDAFLDKQLWIT